MEILDDSLIFEKYTPKGTRNTPRRSNQRVTQISILVSDHQGISKTFCTKYHGEILSFSGHGETYPKWTYKQ